MKDKSYKQKTEERTARKEERKPELKKQRQEAKEAVAGTKLFKMIGEHQKK